MQRKLTVILSADVAGYSGMMETDDAGTLAVLKTNRSTIFDPCVLDPDNLNMRYNMACALVTDLHELEAALNLLEPGFQRWQLDAVTWMKTDPDLDAVREHPRFKAMVAAAEARLAQVQSSRET